MKFEEVLPALRAGQSIQRTSQPIKWAYLKRSTNGAYHWYGYNDDPLRAIPMDIDHVALDADDWEIVDERDAAARKPAASHTCGRRGTLAGDHLDHYSDRNGHQACSYCGSVHPDEFMAAVEAGEVELTPTDKSYKVYITGGRLNHDKFYFQHLGKPQMIRFVELMNEKKLKLAFPGHFYTMPFFIGPGGPG